MENLITLGKRIYDTGNPREVHRLIVFLGRAILHYGEIKRLYSFFMKNKELEELFRINPFPMEQATRAFFYNKATFTERCNLIENHFDYMQALLQPDWTKKLSSTKEAYKIWQSAETDIDWNAQLKFNGGQRKEGLMSVNMYLGVHPIYQIMFWFNTDKNGEPSMWIGAMQGPNLDNSREIIKDITKRSFRYRTKNLILYMTMAVARAFKVTHIYAVSNEGYYANNHVRKDRKLKTDFGEFWLEAGGRVTDDFRFYEIPLIEPRKTMEEVPTRKRAVYRKRFAFQDDVDRQIASNMEKILK